MVLASPEGEYKRVLAELESPAIEVVTGAQLRQARRVDSGREVEISGVVNGLFAAGEKRTILVKLLDGETVEVECEGEQSEARPSARVRCLVKPARSAGRMRYDLLAITADRTPLDVLQNAALTALKFPPKDPAEITRSAAELQGTVAMPTRTGDPLPRIKRAIAHLNQKLTPKQVSTMAENIVTYSARYGVDPYLVVAVIAAESRFNPKARSYKGAMGLGQLMPATAAAHGVEDPYDPAANLEVAIRILKRNLDQYGHGDPNKALAAYNAGRGAVKKYGGVPPYRETRNYLWTIYDYWCWLNGVKAQPRPR